MTGKQHAAVWVGAIVGAALLLLIIAAIGGHAPGGIQDHYPNPTASVTR